MGAVPSAFAEHTIDAIGTGWAMGAVPSALADVTDREVDPDAPPV